MKTAPADRAEQWKTETGGQPVRVLLVDDQRIIAEAVRRMLVDQEDIEFHAVQRSEEALPVALAWKPTVILQDLLMPDIDGFELVRRYRAEAETRELPIIVLSAREDPQLKVQSFSLGANDYLVKLPDRLELLARLRYHSAAYINRLERDTAFRALRESERKLAEANIKLQKLADLDGLTGISNRRRFDDVLQTEWLRAQRSRRPLSLLLCDVDYFKRFNDTYGHVAGDQCLRRVAGVLQASLRRPADLAARYGGEEFALILPETESEGALAVARTCCQAVASLALQHRHSPHGGILTASIGVASSVPLPETEPQSLIALADRALYAAKGSGRNRVAHTG